MIRILLACLLLALPAQALSSLGQDDRDAPYVPTPQTTVEGMLDVAAVQPGDLLIDLGSGDGRIPIAAGKRGARAIGIDNNSALVARANYKAREAGVADRVRFRREDLFTTNVRDADVVSLYLLPEMNLQLRPRLLTEMKPGARIVSHAFDMGDWLPDRFERIDDRRVYLWIVPAVVGGEWRMTLADGTMQLLVLDQRYQKVSGTLKGSLLSDVTLRGNRLAFTSNGARYHAVVGYSTLAPRADADGVSGWRAVR